MTHENLTVVGQAEKIRFPEISDMPMYARVDSGARTSAIWGDAVINSAGKLEVRFFGNEAVHVFDEFERRVVATSTGHIDKRFKVKLLVRLKGRSIRAGFTIANRELQVYPVLIGRNIIRGKFLIDVRQGRVLRKREQQRIKVLQEYLGGSE